MITSSCRFKFAPAPISNFTTSLNPLIDAHIKAVRPSYKSFIKCGLLW